MLKDLQSSVLPVLPAGERGLPGASGYQYDFVTAAIADTIPVARRALYAPDRTAAGDRRGGWFVKSDSEPVSNPSKFQSADGAWWKYASDPRGVSILQIGAKGTFSGTEDQTAFEYALANEPVIFVPRTADGYRITRRLRITQAGQVIVFEPGARLRYDAAQPQDDRMLEVRAADVTLVNPWFDGNAKQVKGALVYVHDDSARLKMLGGARIGNINGSHIGGLTPTTANWQYGLLLSPFGCKNLYLERPHFYSIFNDNSGANGAPIVQGLGFCGGILVMRWDDALDAFDSAETGTFSTPTSGTIVGCVGEDIRTILNNGLTSTEVDSYQDADLIRFYPINNGTTWFPCPLKFVGGLSAIRVGKRAIKIEGAQDVFVDRIYCDARGMQYGMLHAAKVNAEGTQIGGIRAINDASKPMAAAVVCHDVGQWRVENINVDHLDVVLNVTVSGGTPVLDFECNNVRCPNVYGGGFVWTGGVSSKVRGALRDWYIAAPASIHNMQAISGPAVTGGDCEMDYVNFDIRNGDVKIEGRRDRWINGRIIIDDAAFTGSVATRGLFEMGGFDDDSPLNKCEIRGLTIDIRSIDANYLSATRPRLHSIVMADGLIRDVDVRVPSGLTTARSHGLINGSRSVTDGWRYRGAGYREWMVSGSAMIGPVLKNVVRHGSIASTDVMITSSAGQDFVIAGFLDECLTNAVSINITGGTVSATRTFAGQIRDGFSKTSNANVHASVPNVSTSNLVKI